MHSRFPAAEQEHCRSSMRYHMWQKILIISIFNLFFMAAFVSAQEIYKWVDKSGQVHYGTSPQGKNARKADLPEIMRGEVKLPADLLQSCKTHAGVDCQAGADSDGSVICNDGYLDSAQRFTFTCSTAKLEVADVTAADSAGRFNVHVRNSKGVIAEKPEVAFKLNPKTELKLLGPEQIKPYEVEQFIFDPGSQISDKSQLKELENLKPDMIRFELSCLNCP